MNTCEKMRTPLLRRGGPKGVRRLPRETPCCGSGRQARQGKADGWSRRIFRRNG